MISLLLPGLTLTTSPVVANPRGGSIVHGDVTIGAGAGGNLQIRQSSHSAIINWESFSIDAGELTQFRQPNSNAAVLNRVTGGDPSAIHGALKANGNVFVINPNGILVGPGGSIDVHGLVLSTLDVENGEFLAGGDMTFKGVGENVTNMGRINGIGGDVFLIGRTVQNSGSIRASSGTVGLAAGEEVLLTAQGNTGERLFVRAKGAGVSGTGILNDGTIEGAAVELKAHGNMFALAINNKGSIRATGAVGSGGKVYLRGAGGSVSNSGSIRATSAGGGNAGRVLIEAVYAKVDGMIRAEGGEVRVTGTDLAQMEGRIDVSNAVGRGGEVSVEGTEVVLGSTLEIDASGREGGGLVRIGGGFQGGDTDMANAERLIVSSGALIFSDAWESGNGGTVILWSDKDTEFQGMVSAQALGSVGNGGFVEVSGKETLLYDGIVSTLAANGRTGTLLLDPEDFAIGATTGVNSLSAADLVTALNSSSVVVSTGNADLPGETGTITVSSTVAWNNANQLSLLAHGDIRFDASVRNAGTGNLVAIAGWNGTDGYTAGTPGGNASGVLNFSDFVANPAWYGNANGSATGSVYVGSGSQTVGIGIGSLSGETNVAGYDVFLTGSIGDGLNGSSSFAQIGYSAAGNGFGDIQVHAINQVSLTAGPKYDRAHAQIGHGGYSVAGNKGGNITVETGNGVTLTADQVGGGRFGYAQIGHGGRGIATADSHFTGNITVDGGAGSVDLVAGQVSSLQDYRSAQIGHGGPFDARGNFSGDIRVTGSHVNLKAGVTGSSYARVGHGGWTGGVNTGNRSGSIYVSTPGEVSIDDPAGGGVAAIGHHNVDATGTIFDAHMTIQAASMDNVFGASGGNVFAVGGLFANMLVANLAGGDVSLHATGVGGILVNPSANMVFTAANDLNLLSEYDVVIERTVQNGGDGNINVVAGWDSVVAPLADPITGIISGVDMENGIFGIAGSFANHNGSVIISNAAATAAVGSLSGETNVAGYDVTLTGTSNGFAQIGYSLAGDGFGNIRVGAINQVSLAAGPRYDLAHAQIGHGGYQIVGNKGGNITVRAGNGVTLTADQAGTGRFAAAQIGHGGRGATSQGNQYTGNITVDGGAGSVDLVAGQVSVNSSWEFRHAQIGHGWSHDAWGDFSGDIRVTAANVNLDAGAAATSYARVGHGGWSSGTNTGDRTGNIYVGASGEISIEDPPGGGVAAIGHHKGAGDGTIHDAHVTVVAASMDNVFGASGGNVFAIDNVFANMIAANLAGGDVSLHATGAGGMFVNPGVNMTFTSANDFNLLSEYDVALQGIVKNLGDGGVTAVAGWSPMVAPLADPLTGIIADVDVAGDLIGVANSYGNNGGTFTVGASSTAAAIGSAYGATSVFGHAVEVIGGDSVATSYAQIGTVGVSASGSITVMASGGVTVRGGDSDSSHAQVGHGGLGMTAASGISGTVTVHAGTGGVRLEGGDGSASFAQIGNGGYDVEGIVSGETIVRALGTAPADGIRLKGGNGNYTGATIGLGNYFIEQPGSSASGAVTVEVANGGLTLESSTDGYFSYAQIGHSGRDSSGGRSGDVSVVVAGGDITLTAGGVNAASRYNHVQIGHGGYGNGVVADFSGMVTVKALDGGISVDAGDNYGAFAQIGHGGMGAGSGTAGDLSGGIEVRAKGDINFNAGTASYAHAMLGHGGYNIDGNIKGGMGETISVTSDEGSINFTADPTADVLGAFAQLGHGGLSSSGSTDAAIAVTALNGGVTFQGGGTGSNYGAYAQIGHGGYLAPGDHRGAISVTARGPSGIFFTGGNGYFASARIGHGGRQAEGNHSGDITIDAGTGALEFEGGSGQNYTAVQIGHGAYGATGNHSGTISVSAGSVRLEAGTGADQISAQIGHGGYDVDGNHSGEITVRAVTGDVSLIGGDGLHNFAQIGHGGAVSQGSMGDDICVTASGAVLLDSSAATGSRAYTQIGHGGYDADGDHVGDINVVSGYGGTGGLTLVGGGQASAYSQIGHGGAYNNGALSGDINVIAENGDISLTGGGTDAYAMFGHGDGSKTSTGTREGGMHIFASGNLTGAGGTGAANEGNVYIFHQNNNGLQPADYLGGDGYQKVVNGTISLSGYTTADEGTIISANLGIGLVRIVDNSVTDYTIDLPDLAFDTSADFYLITGGNITMLSSYQNKGAGNVTLVAGWNGDGVVADSEPGVTYPSDGMGGFNYCEPTIGHKASINIDFNDCETFGNDGKTLTIGSAMQTSRVSIGSAGGTNTFAAAGIRLFSSDGTANAATQLGYYGDGNAITGAIDVRVKELGLSLNSGNAIGAFTQIGHGGAGSDASGGVLASIDISFCDASPGDVSVLAGTGDGAYAQIGHGGAGSSGIFSGAVTIDGAHNITLAGSGRHAYAQIGHGGSSGMDGTYSGGNPSFGLRALSASGVVEVINTTGAISLTGGAGLENAYVQIGHGGVGISSGAIGGDVTVEAGAGGVLLQGGLGSSAHALIGNGGYQIASTIEGTVRVDAKGSGTGDGIRLRGGDGDHTYSAPRSGFSGAMIGNGGYNSSSEMSGDTLVTVQNGGLTMEAGDGYYSNTTIGHTGHGNGGAMNGLIDVDVAGGDILLEAGSKELFAFSQIGHGGWDNRDHGGDIVVTAGQGDITIRSGNAGTYNSAKIGHGTYGNGSVQSNVGAITVEATTGAVALESRAGTYAYTQIGHGGLGKNSFMRGEFHDAITVTAGTGVKLGAGSRADTFAMIGHGGTNVSGIFTGAVNVNAGAEGLIMTGGSSSRAFAQVGHGGYNEAGAVGLYTINAAPVTVNAGLVELTGGSSQAYAQIGHGGYNVNGTSGGASSADSAISVTTTGTSAMDGVRLKGGTGADSFAMIGSGGRGGAFDVFGDISVTSAGGGISLGGTVTNAFAMIGHGGTDVRGSFRGAVNVNATTAGLVLAGGSGSLAFAQVGHGGNNASGAAGIFTISAAPITVEAGLVDLRGGGTSSYALIGHGGAYMNGSSGSGNAADSAISVTTTGTSATDGVRLRGGAGSTSFAMIGSGGRHGIFDVIGDVTVTSAGGGISLVGTTSSAFALIGNGGHVVAGAFSGTTTVHSNGGGGGDGIRMQGGSGSYSFANIGHATNDVSGSMLNSDTVVKILGGGLTLQAGSGTLAGASIGLQSRAFFGERSGIVDVTVNDGDVLMTGGSGTASFVQIGHGGWGQNGIGSLSGDVTLKVDNGTLTMHGGDVSAVDDYGKFAMIGHGGGAAYSGTMTGSVLVDVQGSIAMLSGPGGDGFTKIGHGGRTRTGDMGSAGEKVEVFSRAGGLSLAGGTGIRAFSMIGSGGSAVSGAVRGSVFVDVNDTISMEAGDGAESFTLIGHGGRSRSGALGAAGDVVQVTSRTAGLSMANGNGSQAFSMIGMGGSSSTGNKTGDVIVSTVTDVVMDGTVGSGLQAFLQIGHGGYSSGGTGFNGVVSVTSSDGGLDMSNGNGDAGYAMVGHGGHSTTGNKTGDVTVSNVDGVTMDGTVGSGLQAFLQIGHGGYSSGGTTHSGAVSVTGSAVDSAVILKGGNGNVSTTIRQYGYAMIGHGGASSSATKQGAVTVLAGSGGVSLIGGGVSDFSPGIAHPVGFARIGHGGASSGGAANGAISVTSANGGNIVLHGGGRGWSHAQIGHGGLSSVSGLQTGAISVTSAGKVELRGAVYSNTGVSSNGSPETFAQIGHGGMFATSTYGGAIDVSAQTGVLLESGASTYTRAQIGHGGYQAGTGTGATVEMVNAAVTVRTATGGVVLDATKASSVGYALAMIGNGGTGLAGAIRTGTFRGDIVVDGGTGNVELHGGNSGGSGAMIGNGGTSLSGNHSGNINVKADGDLVMDLRTSINNNTFARIGHGGIGSGQNSVNLDMSGNMGGDICVQVGGQVVLDATGGTRVDNYVQIGHGGGRAVGDFTGNITVVARSGDGIALTGGSGTGAYSQIGHGGSNTAGTMTGNVYVIAETGDITLNGGSGAGAYAMFGHGDGAKTSTGQRGGGMHIFASGDLTGTGGSGGLNEGNVYIFHQNNNGLQVADYLVGSGDGYQKVVNGDISLPNYVTVDESTMISGNLGFGFVQIVDNSATDYVINSQDTEFDTSADFFLLTGGNITMLSSYQNKGSGSVTLVAGWNGVGDMVETGSVTYASNGMGGFNYCKPTISEGSLSGIDFNNCDTFGNDGKTLTIGSVGQTGRVSIGSAGGTNTFAAAGIEMFASDGTAGAAAQLGFYSDGTAATGAINVRVKELGLVLNSGQAANAFVQIGHGGTFSTATGGVNAAIDISFCAPGDVILNAEDPLTQASGTGSYAQIGHGGNDWDGAKRGTVTIDGARDVILNAGARDAYAQIGHGGAGVSDAYGTGEARGDIEIVNTAGKIGLYGGTGLNATAQIGHGGVAMRAPMSGTVTVEAGTGGIELLGNSGSRTYALIGHGGYNIDSQIDGDVTVEAKGTAATDGIVMSGGAGGYSGAFIGNGIYLNSAAVNGFTKVSVLNGGIAMGGGAGESSKVGIGHSNNTDNITMTGYVEVDIAEGGLTMNGGTGLYASATIGHEKNAGTATIIGDVHVDVRKGDITLTGGLGQYANATIGHAGRGGTSTSSGDVTVLAGDGDISITGGSSTVGTSFAVARIGHGIWESGTKTGVITVTAEQGDILVQGGLGSSPGNYNFAQIGHGGYGNGSTQNIVDQAIHVTATLGSVSLNGGNADASFAQIGHGGLGRNSFFLGSFSGDITVRAGNAISLNGGRSGNTHAQIGNGGAGLRGPVSGNVLVEAGTGGITLNGGTGTNSFAAIGNGGQDIDNDVSGTTTVRALGTNAATDGIRLKGGNGEQSIAHIGHLHTYGIGAVSGNVEVTAATGDIELEAGDTGYFAHAQIGHGGRDSDSDKSGTIAVTAENGDVILRAGGARGSSHYAHAQIGHGGYTHGMGSRAYGDDIRVESVTGSVSLTGGNAAFDYAQIGHGGTASAAGMSVSFSGKVDVLAAEDVILEAGTADTTYAQIGHGGLRGAGSALSSVGGAVDASAITVQAGRDVLLSGGMVGNSGAKIGHGHNGQALSGFVENSITVDAGRHVELVSAQFGSYTSMSSSGTQIGHGGREAPVDGGDSGYSGDIVLNAGGKLDLIAAKNATTFNYALVGHTAYFNVRGNHSGNISVKTGTVAGHADYGIHIASGTRDDAAATSNSYYSFAGIGHHGHSNGAGGGDLAGDITVVAERGGLTLKGGMNASSSTEVRLHAAQIGHGDYNSDGLKTGNIKVCIADDILLENGSARQSPVQIGHGGFSHDGNITGWIEVSSLNGDIVLDSSQGGNADIANTQIGHGGYTSTGTFDGDISLAAAGDIRLTGGSANATHSQIGHGGVGSNGTFIGNIHLLAGGDFTLTGGGHRDGYAMVGHGSASPLTSGVRRGGMRLMVGGDTVLTDNLSGVRLGHGTTTAGGISDAGIILVTGTLDLSGHARGVSDIANEMGQDGEVTFAVLDGDLLVDGGGASFDHGFDVSFVASGDVTMLATVQNLGSGNVGAASGWDSLEGYDPVTHQFDGSNGLTFELDFNNCLTMEILEFDFGVVAGDDSLWGHNGGKVLIGDGSQTAAVAFGSAGGSTVVLGDAVEVRGSDTTSGAYGMVGLSPAAGVSPTGSITVKALTGGVSVVAGDQGVTYAQIGHRSLGTLTSSISGDIEITSGGEISLRGGDALQASAQIGHGGVGSTLSGISGTIFVSVATDLEVIGGLAAAAYAQIGHGGLFTSADIEGDIQVNTGGSIALRSLAPALSAYAKIGHGDDARGAFATLGGSGTRDGDILVATGDSIEMESAMIGHLNSQSPATALGGETWIGVSRDDPADPAGGFLQADAGSEFSGAEAVRFYLPRRGSNRIATGAKINGVIYDGGVSDPWPVQRADEYTNFLQTSGGTTQPLEHNDVMGSGPTPTVSGGFAFYYNLIVLGGSFPPDPLDPDLPGGGGTPGDGPGGDDIGGPQEISYLSMFPDDRTFDDWLRDQEELFSYWGPFNIYYEGFPQYGYNGESIFEHEE